MTIMCCALQRTILHDPALLNICTFVEKELDDLRVPVSGGEHQRRIAAVIALVNRRPFINVFFHPIVIPIYAVAPDVRLLGNKPSSLSRSGRRASVSRASLASTLASSRSTCASHFDVNHAPRDQKASSRRASLGRRWNLTRVRALRTRRDTHNRRAQKRAFFFMGVKTVRDTCGALHGRRATA